MDSRETLIDVLNRVPSAFDAELSTFDDVRQVLVFAGYLFALVVSSEKKGSKSDNVPKGNR